MRNSGVDEFVPEKEAYVPESDYKPPKGMQLPAHEPKLPGDPAALSRKKSEDGS